MPTLISRESPGTPDARALIADLEAELVPLYPQASRHGYSVDKLIAQGVGHVPMLEQPERSALDYLQFRARL